MDFRPHYRRTFEDGIKWLIFIFFRHSRYLLSPFVGNLALSHVIFVWLPPLYAVAKIYSINKAKVQEVVWWEVLVFQGIEVARRIRDEERGGKAKLVIIGTISHCRHSIWGLEVTLKRQAPRGRWVKKERKPVFYASPAIYPCALPFFPFTSYQVKRPLGGESLALSLQRRDSVPLAHYSLTGNMKWRPSLLVGYFYIIRAGSLC